MHNTRRLVDKFTGLSWYEWLIQWVIEIKKGDIMENIGLYNKYIINKSDGTDIDINADYFVLRLDKDIRARKALRVFAESIKKENPVFSNDINVKLDMYELLDSLKGGCYDE